MIYPYSQTEVSERTSRQQEVMAERWHEPNLTIPPCHDSINTSWMTSLLGLFAGHICTVQYLSMLVLIQRWFSYCLEALKLAVSFALSVSLALLNTILASHLSLFPPVAIP